MTCAAGMPMYSESYTSGATVKADIDLTADHVLRIGGEYQRYRLDDYWKASGGGMWPGTFQNINDGERDRAAVFGEWESQLDMQWLTLLGVRYERVTTDADDVQGYKTTAPAPGNQIAEAAAFNASDRSKTDDNWDLAALARYTHDAHPGRRIRGGAQGALAESLRALHLVQLDDGGGHEQLRRRR